MPAPAFTYPRSLRLRLELTGELRLGQHAPVAVHVIDLSQRGAFVETEATAPSGEAARLTLDLPDGPLRIEAVVAREGTALREAVHPDLDTLVVRAPGLGLRFVSLREAERQRLEAFLAQVREGR
jgi:hypothetical protein